MSNQKSATRYYQVVYLSVLLAVVGGILFYSGVPWGEWPVLLILTCLSLYLQTVSVNVGARMNVTLSTSVMFPTIYLLGTTPAMLIALATGLADGFFNQKAKDRVAFNVAQLAISALLSSMIFSFTLNLLGPHGFTGIFAMFLGIIVYVGANLGQVTFLVSILREVSWFEQLSLVGFGTIYSSLGSGFIGILFTYFIVSYKIWGVIAYAILLLYLSSLLKVAAELRQEQSIRRELEEELLLDEMTGAANFRFLTKWMGEPSQGKTAVLFLDLDNFKSFNDRFGHVEGDQVLKLVVDTIRENIRTSDQVVRYGGDEFVVILPGMDKAGGMLVAKRIVINLRKSTLAKWRESITVSVGVVASPEDTEDKRQLLLMADQAMYRAKNLGKDTVQVC